MKLNPLLSAALAGACGLVSSAAHADATSWDPSWAFSGFGTLGYVATSTDQALFADPGQPGGVGKAGGFGPDSKLGGQVNAKANSVFSVTVQGVAERNPKGAVAAGTAAGTEHNRQDIIAAETQRSNKSTVTTGPRRSHECAFTAGTRRSHESAIAAGIWSGSMVEGS